MAKSKFVKISGVVLAVLLLWTVKQFEHAQSLLAQSGAESKSPAKQITYLADPEIRESSGLVLSQRHDNCFWTHNDSGDAPRLFLVHRDGRTIARLKIAGAKALDWEDIASATIHGTPKLIIGDIGGNALKRDHVTLYILSEPKFLFDDSKPKLPIESVATVETAIDVVFNGGVTNYEGIAVDRSAKSILIFEKSFTGRVYSIPLPDSTKKRMEVEAKYIGQTGIPFASACDIAKDNKSMVVINYGTGFLFLRRTAANGHVEEWSESFKREPVLFVLPKMRQSEAVCFSKDAKSIYLTSEQVPTPLIQMTLPVDVAIGR